jgi:hypothetical protein
VLGFSFYIFFNIYLFFILIVLIPIDLLHKNYLYFKIYGGSAFEVFKELLPIVVIFLYLLVVVLGISLDSDVFLQAYTVELNSDAFTLESSIVELNNEDFTIDYNLEMNSGDPSDPNDFSGPSGSSGSDGSGGNGGPNGPNGPGGNDLHEASVGGSRSHSTNEESEEGQEKLRSITLPKAYTDFLAKNSESGAETPKKESPYDFNKTGSGKYPPIKYPYGLDSNTFSSLKNIKLEIEALSKESLQDRISKLPMNTSHERVMCLEELYKRHFGKYFGENYTHYKIGKAYRPDLEG